MGKRTQKRRWRRFLQFRLCTLLGFMLLVAALAAWYLLSLRGCTDVGMRYVGQMKKLNSLDISGHITDEGLEQLHELPMLHRVHLLDPGVTDGGIAEFRRRQPGVTLIHEDPSTHKARIVH